MVVLIDVEHDVFVDRSTIPGAGRGLFALRDFHKNEIVIPYSGEELTPMQATKRYPRRDAKYLFCPTERRCIDARDPKKSSYARYANSLPWRQANAKLTVRGNITAKKLIKEGEEIFVSYGTAFNLGS